MKKLAFLLISIALVASGCTTVKCNHERNADGTATVTVAFNKSKIAGVITGIAQNAVSINGDSLLNLIKSGSEDGTLLKPEEQAKFAEKAVAEATKYVNEHSAEFCNTCPSGHQCKAALEKFEPKVDGIPSVQKSGDTVIVVIKFKWEGAISCSACPECEVQSQQQDKLMETGAGSSTAQSCEGEENLVLEPGVVVGASQAAAILQ